MPSSLEFDSIISAAYSDGRTRFGELGLTLRIFSERICSIVQKHLGLSPAPSQELDFLKSLHGGDLYLATACAQHSPGMMNGENGSADPETASSAWRLLERTYKGFICDLVRFFYSTSFAAQDLADSILADLFLPDRSGTSRIASYDGRSSLSTWLRVVVCNRAINARRCSATVKSTDLQNEIPDGPALESIELTVLARRYGDALGDSLKSACSGLTPRERLILLWRYEDGLQLGQIARLLGIHQSNVTRQLERMQGKLRDEVVNVLTQKHGLSRSAIQECIQDIVENPRHGVSILDFIKAKGEPTILAKPEATRQKRATPPPLAQMDHQPLPSARKVR